VKTTGNPTALVSAIKQEVINLDKNVPIYDIKTMEERAKSATSRTRFSAWLLGLFAGFALLLSAIGIYGIISYAVSSRTQEIGIRMALGAEQKDVLKLVILDALFLILIGLSLGLVAAFAATRVLASQLYEVGTTDPATFVTVSILLAGVALLASYFPARRATRVDPMVALRYE
jgi:putative ABC transport system permease protein